METMTRESRSTNGEMSRGFSDPRGLKIRAVMSKDVVTAGVDETVAAVAKKMAEGGVSCIVVTEGKQISGIFTERDLVRGIAHNADDSGAATMSERMSFPVETIGLQVPVLDAAEMMESKGIKRLPVVSGDQMVGIVTQTDITRGLVLLSPLECISDVMSENLATVDAGQSVAEAAQTMSGRDISCVVVVENGAAVGVLTEKDLVRYAIDTEHKPSETLVAQVMSSPVQCVAPGCSVLSANQKMSALRLRRLVVVQGKAPQGVVSQSDIMRAVRAEFERADADRTSALSAITERVQHIGGEVTELGEFLLGCFNDAGRSKPMDAAASRQVVAAEVLPRIQHIMDELTRL
jgi:CBS domain-containing protein